MGREIKRVPLDFNWPVGEVWKGYVNPHYARSHRCEACDGSGYSPEARMLTDLWYGRLPFHSISNGSVPFPPTHPKIIAYAERNCGGKTRRVADECRRLADECLNNHWSHHLDQSDVDALVAHERLCEFTHTWVAGEGWKPITPAPVVTAAQVNEWSMFGMGHDSINSHICIEARCKRYGWNSTCADCEGHGDTWESPQYKEAAENWQEEGPPAGDGWQLWETVSDGSPISPPFATPEELADWLVVPGHGWSTDAGTTREQWLKFISKGWSPSMVSDGHQLQTGVQYMADQVGAT